jgi:hypothetical protein
VSRPNKSLDAVQRKYLRERGIELAKLAELALHHSREWMAVHLLELAHVSFERSFDGQE